MGKGQNAAKHPTMRRTIVSCALTVYKKSYTKRESYRILPFQEIWQSNSGHQTYSETGNPNSSGLKKIWTCLSGMGNVKVGNPGPLYWLHSVTRDPGPFLTSTSLISECGSHHRTYQKIVSRLATMTTFQHKGKRRAKGRC